MSRTAHSVVRYMGLLVALGLCAVAPAGEPKASTKDASPPQSPLQQVTEQCEAGDAMACRRLAVHYANSEDKANDLPKSVAMFEKACASSDYDSCNMAAAQYSKGEGVTQDQKKAFDLYSAACAGKSAVGCLNAGVMVYKGEGVPHNVQRAVDLFKQACDLKEQKGCDNYKAIMGP